MRAQLYVGNLSYTTVGADLQTLFAEAGQVVSVALLKNRDMNNPKGFALIEMSTRSEAKKAIMLLNGFTLDNRKLRVNLARPLTRASGSNQRSWGKRRQVGKIEETLMQFKVDDFVVHPVHGIGHIVEIAEKRFSGKETRLYYKLIWPRRVVWIPVEAQATIGLRLVTAKSDLERYRNLLKSRPVPLPQKHYLRHLELVGRLKQSSFQVVCEVVRDLTAWGWRKPLGSADTTILQKARESLYQEWATAAGVTNLEAIKEIDALLGASQQAFMG